MQHAQIMMDLMSVHAMLVTLGMAGHATSLMSAPWLLVMQMPIAQIPQVHMNVIVTMVSVGMVGIVQVM